MKPRVFVSSTYYDLKHIRESINRFIRRFGFEPVLFEDGNVHFEHGKELDSSCYKEVHNCHMMVLIIGGRYGSSSSESNQKEVIEEYEKNYISVTRNEFRTAVKENIPIFIFIDKNVHAEYYTYSKNRDFFKKEDYNTQFEFAHVDNRNIFDFIDEVKSNAIKTFERFEEIEKYLLNQWSAMFYSHLLELKNKNKNQEVLYSVNELQSITEKMNEMIDSIGKNILKDSGQYEDVVIKQNKKQIQFYTKRIIEKFFQQYDKSVGSYDVSTDIIFQLSEVMYDKFFNHKDIWEDDGDFFELRYELEEFDDKLTEILQPYLIKIDSELRLEKGSFVELFKIYKEKIKPLMGESLYQSYFKEVLQNELESILVCPF